VLSPEARRRTSTHCVVNGSFSLSNSDRGNLDSTAALSHLAEEAGPGDFVERRHVSRSGHDETASGFDESIDVPCVF
jgi:hypothetical protein